MQSRMDWVGTSSGETEAERSSRTLSIAPVSIGSAMATITLSSPSIRSGIRRACLAKLMGTLLSRSCEISSAPSRIW